MDIQVNGNNQTLQEGLTVSDLLHQLDICPEQVAIELNLKILDRQDFPTSVLHQGDTVEILSFIGGGT
ncbi:MAG: sulfur carrier protein ThiS [Nitrospirales bacterium]|nr:sulfur carrier protein ThiS [Nitrospira sp.]MDR4501667.1 sulfur carrier protein ThiS [Nitrospirales bacterium]